MSWYVRALAAVVFYLSLLGGCPLAPIDGVGGANSDVAAGAPGAGGDASTVVNSESYSDQLEEWFPGCTEATEGESWQSEVLRLLNDERTSRGLGTLTRNVTLENQASEYACEMVYYDFFAHENPVTGSGLPDRAAEFGYSYAVVGENLAAGQQSPIEAVRDWMNSPGHRDNILGERYTEAGVGVRTGGQYHVYWVVEFGCPR